MKAITLEAAAAAVGTLLPEGAIVVDEALTAAAAFLSRTRGAASHDYLQVTGGAIGIGLPLATGAAVACPDRKVVCLQADGSAMYTVQALWTQARESLDVTTIFLNNRSYAILKQELANFGAERCRAQGTRHDGARPAGTRLGRPRPRHGRGGGTRQDDGGARPAVRRQSALRGPVSDRPRAVAAPSPPLPPRTCSARRNLVYRPSIVRGSMRSSRSGFTPGAKSSSPMGCREHTSLPRGYAEYLIVCITSISPLQRRSPDRAPGGWFPADNDSRANRGGKVAAGPGVKPITGAGRTDPLQEAKVFTGPKTFDALSRTARDVGEVRQLASNLRVSSRPPYRVLSSIS